jgi:Terminase RNaseH-like domain
MRGFAAFAAAHKRRVELEAVLGLGQLTVHAVDFLSGGRADFARAIGLHGVILELIRRLEDEPYDVFIERAQSRAETLEASHLTVGGIDPDLFLCGAPEAPARDAIALPDGPLHIAQRDALPTILGSRRAILRAGRRFGKTALMCAIAANDVLCGRSVAYVVPQYKTAAPVFAQLLLILASIIRHKDRGRLEIDVTSTGGSLSMLSVESGFIIGRGRKFHRMILDEIAHVPETANMPMIWASSLAPTLLDYRGSAIAASTPFGMNPSNFFFQIASSKELDWQERVAPTSDNPFRDREELEDIKRRTNPLVWRQEYMAEFTSLDGAALFNLANMLQPDGTPWPEPGTFQVFYCAIDTAMKTGSANDGTAVVYVALTETHKLQNPIMWILDWDLLQVGAGKIGPWFEMVWARCRELMGKRTIRAGPCFIEDAAAGTVILETYDAKTEALPSSWLAKGKDLRCYAVEGYMNSGRVRLTERAYAKTVQFKELTMNHLWSQLNGFVMGDREAHKRSDDLLEACVYCASVACLERPVEKRAS